MSFTNPTIKPGPPFLMNDQLACSKGDHKWLPWLHSSPSNYRTICSVCRLACSYVQGEWFFRQSETYGPSEPFNSGVDGE